MWVFTQNHNHISLSALKLTELDFKTAHPIYLGTCKSHFVNQQNPEAKPSKKPSSYLTIDFNSV